MTPLIKSGQEHVLSPINLSDVEVGDIGNNHGKINGWTKSVFGKVTKIL